MNVQTAALWQADPTSYQVSDHHLLTVFIGMVAIALVIQAICVIAGVIVLFITAARVKRVADEAYANTLPLLAKSQQLLEELSPKVNSIAENVQGISQTVREKTEELGRTVSELNRTMADTNSRARSHISHADRIVGSALDTTEEIKDTVAHGIRGPVKQIAGLVAGVRAGIETLITRVPYGRASAERYAQDVPVIILTEE